jgi:hypothetical protein
MRNNYYITLKFFICDAREAIKKLNTKYNYIFHDGFTPSKLPTLWSVDFLCKLYEVLEDLGNITTYTTAAAVKSGFKNAGFLIGKILLKDKAIGTIAFKNSNNIINPLSNIETGLLGTKAGIPYRDNNLCNSSETIIKNRETEISVSIRQGASSFLKNNGVKTTFHR